MSTSNLSVAEINAGVTDPDNPMETPYAAMKYQFSSDELRALKECNRESFYFRCIPFGSFLGAGTYFAVKAGYLSANPKWGALPKVFTAITIGYFGGKFSYQQKCVEKLMALPDSQLAEMLKKQRGRGIQEVLTMQEPSFSSAAASYTSSANPNNDAAETPTEFTDVGDTRPTLSFDSDSSIFGGVDYGPSDNENQMKEDTLPPKPPQFFTNYETLRKQNRDGYETARAQHIQNSVEAQQAAQRKYQEVQRSTRIPGSQQAQSVGKSKNIYGDVWDDKVE